MGVKSAAPGSGHGGVRINGGRMNSIRSVKEGNAQFFAVIYLAPGDYHRFHHPAAWVVENDSILSVIPHE
jgi:phosphatidylserine decarboxylase